MTGKEIVEFFDNTTIEFKFEKKVEPHRDIFNSDDTKNRWNQLKGLDKAKVLNLYIPTTRDYFKASYISVVYDSQKNVIVVFYKANHKNGFFEVEKNEMILAERLFEFLINEENKIDTYKLKDIVTLKEIEPIDKEKSNEK